MLICKAKIKAASCKMHIRSYVTSYHVEVIQLAVSFTKRLTNHLVAWSEIMMQLATGMMFINNIHNMIDQDT